MKKFTDKQLREEIDGLRKKVQLFLDIRMRAEGMLLHADMIEFLMKRNAAELESQHRKTWALAMNTVANNVDVYGDTSSTHERCGDIRAIPCPPIEATKDK